MTPEQQRIAIAEACGWTDIRRPCDSNYHDLPTDTLRILYGQVCGIPPGWVHSQNSRPLPDYLNDLNAMHEAEKMLDGSQIDQYKHRLCVLVTDKERISQSATAAQRAEAFLRTLNLWTP
jgi:hypothetical protein